MLHSPQSFGLLGALVDLKKHSPAALHPVTVAKPWGVEIWYSGIEARGESGVCAGGQRLPLSRYLEAHGRCKPPILLKALRPETGNLYVEVHETKHEVYVVDQLTATSRPAGAHMLLGANVGKRRTLGDDRFRTALLDAARTAQRTGNLRPITALLNPITMRRGDAVTIPPRMPHSLLRGVHVIEFQTPVFERKILAASQPVATQRGWDSAAAVSIMDLSPPLAVVPWRKAATQALAHTPAFALRRHRLAPAAVLEMEPWSVGWVVNGELAVAGRRFPPRTAFIAAAPACLHAASKAEVLVATESGANHQ